MSELEQQILDLIQDAFPLVERPYEAIAELLGSDERTVFETVENLRASGVIRRIGGVYDSKKLGFISRLCAGMVPSSGFDFSAKPHEQTAMEKFAAAVKEIPAITHNYIRSHEYNVWWTVIAQNENEIQAVIDNLCATTDLHDVHAMSATRKFKINTVMRSAVGEKSLGNSLQTKDSGAEAGMTSKEPGASALCHPERSTVGAKSMDLAASDKDRIGIACGDLPHSLTPFKEWGILCDELREDLASKRMRRFGAILRHQEAGFAFNAMVCFKIDSAAITAAGSLLASNPHISHCYERPAFENFPYNVYAMMHANSAEQLNQFIADCVESLNALQSSPVEYAELHSVRELKKTSFKFFA